MSKDKYSNEELIQRVKEFMYKYNRIPSCSDFKSSNGLPTFPTYKKAFGLNKAEIFKNMDIDVYDFITSQMKNTYINIYNQLDRCPINKEYKLFKNTYVTYNNIKKYYDGKMYKLAKECGIDAYINNYTKKDLVDSIKSFVKEFHRIPIATDFENLKGYPSRKTFSNICGNFNDVVRLAGFEPVGVSFKDNKISYTKQYWIHRLNKYIGTNNKAPTSFEFSRYCNRCVSKYILELFGTWNNFLTEAGLPTTYVERYDDEFLHSEFERFVKQYGRIPKYKEFNNSEYPSFWCYQDRFGSWNKAVVAYGYEPNDKNRKYYLDDGEICCSAYEYDISRWLKKHSIQYIRDVKYKTFIDGYKGKMDCDYVITYNNQLWYVEMAGFLSCTDFNKFSSEEKNYYFKLKYKRKMLRRQQLNYVIIEASDFKQKSLSELFYFLNIKE